MYGTGVYCSMGGRSAHPSCLVKITVPPAFAAHLHHRLRMLAWWVMGNGMGGILAAKVPRQGFECSTGTPPLPVARLAGFHASRDPCRVASMHETLRKRPSHPPNEERVTVLCSGFRVHTLLTPAPVQWVVVESCRPLDVDRRVQQHGQYHFTTVGRHSSLVWQGRQGKVRKVPSAANLARQGTCGRTVANFTLKFCRVLRLR